MYRVAFFGSDLFSLASLKAVHKLKAARPDVIGSLTVATRELKPSGRGMKNIYQPPIVDFALENNLPWLQVETPEHFSQLSSISNLAIAVSYGKLIPAAYLKALTYGGLNVHPSLLPQYRGAAPLQRAIMDQQPYSGVSVQSLHPTKFDHGTVLWQSTPVALDARETTACLNEKLAAVGADGLVEVLTQHPEGVRHIAPVAPSRPPSRAPIIDREEYRINFNDSAQTIDACGRALDKLWFEQRVEQKVTKSGKPKGHPVLRINLSGFVPISSTEIPVQNCEVGSVIRGRSPENLPILALRVSDGFVGATHVTVAGSKKETASEFFSQIQKRRLKDVIVN